MWRIPVLVVLSGSPLWSVVGSLGASVGPLRSFIRPLRSIIALSSSPSFPRFILHLISGPTPRGLLVASIYVLVIGLGVLGCFLAGFSSFSGNILGRLGRPPRGLSGFGDPGWFSRLWRGLPGRFGSFLGYFGSFLGSRSGFLRSRSRSRLLGGWSGFL